MHLSLRDYTRRPRHDYRDLLQWLKGEAGDQTQEGRRTQQSYPQATDNQIHRRHLIAWDPDAPISSIGPALPPPTFLTGERTSEPYGLMCKICCNTSFSSLLCCRLLT